ncbi:hypothetical protein J6590_031411 [Homalodisca vitripennis]|nr:hypothetical protein J6590_031411 [Homalodisca vitripennis]
MYIERGKHDATTVHDETTDHIKQRYGNEGLHTWRHVSALMPLIRYLNVSDMFLLVGRNRESMHIELTRNFFLTIKLHGLYKCGVFKTFNLEITSCGVMSSRHDQAKPLVNLLVRLFF